MPPFTEEEIVERRGTLGASEIAAVVGINPYATAHNVWLEKMGLGQFDGNEATELGNALEDAILSVYTTRYGRPIRKGNRIVGQEPWISATPDAHIVTGGLVEAKLVGFRTVWQWGPGNTDDVESDEAPLHYIAQAQWQMMVTREPFADIAALMGTEFRTYRIRPNMEVQARLLDQGRAFWQRYVLTKTPPPVDGSEGAREMLAKLYPRSGGDRIRATPELESLAELLKEARERLSVATYDKKDLENQMRAILGKAPGAYSTRWRVRYSTTKTGSRPFVFEHDLEEKKGCAT
jgi:putative phage-type endonuclease